jgi:hypothetical protein
MHVVLNFELWRYLSLHRQPVQPPPPPPPLKKKEESSDAVGFGDGNVIWPFSNLEVAPGAR